MSLCVLLIWLAVAKSAAQIPTTSALCDPERAYIVRAARRRSNTASLKQSVCMREAEHASSSPGCCAFAQRLTDVLCLSTRRSFLTALDVNGSSDSVSWVEMFNRLIERVSLRNNDRTTKRTEGTDPESTKPTKEDWKARPVSPPLMKL